MPTCICRILCVVSVAAIAFSSAPANAQQPSSVVKIQIDTGTTVAEIPESFLGFGYETSAVAQPGFFSSANRRMIRLYQNLTPRGLIRIGGNVSDHTRFIADGTPAVKTEREVTVINLANLKDLGDFARAAGWQVMWGLNLGTGKRAEAVDEAAAVDQALGSALHSFEIGNEVDLMRKFSRNFDLYHAAYLEYKAAIRGRLPHAVFSGPDVAGNLSYVEKFVADEASDMKLATHHYYRACVGNPNATMERLLQPDAAWNAKLDRLRSLCIDHHLDYRINEVNSFCGGGKQGVSDTFASALWCLDYMFNLASHGCSGVNMETDINQLGFISHYSPIVHDTSGICSARPEYYALLAFAMAGHGHLMKTSVAKNEINLSAYATESEQKTVYITLINKDFMRDASIECHPSTGFESATAYRLTAPAIDARSDVRLAGAAVSDDGSWKPATSETVQISGNIARIDLAHASAIVLKLQRP